MSATRAVTPLALNHYYPGFSPVAIAVLEHYKEQFPAGYPNFTTPWSRETIIVDKMPCLRAYAPSGNRTDDPLIMSREHEPIRYSAPTVYVQYVCVRINVILSRSLYSTQVLSLADIQVLGQLPTTTSDKNKAQLLPTGTTIPRTIPTRTTPH